MCAQSQAQVEAKTLNWGIAPRLMPKKSKLMPARVSVLIPGMAAAISFAYRAMALAETDEHRTRIDRSRMSLDYLELFCTPHKKAEMTEDEQKEYEAAVALFKEKKTEYNLKYNLHTSGLSNT